jgi:DNA-binding transcriptional MerR regulator
MSSRNGITLGQASEYFHVEIEVVRSFAEFGLCPTVDIDGETRIEIESMDRLREIISLYQALGINKEGIEIILDLRGKISDLQDQVEGLRQEVERLRSQLRGEGPEMLKGRGLLIEIDE